MSRISYRAELRPSPGQIKQMLQAAGNARWAYNWGIADDAKWFDSAAECAEYIRAKDWQLDRCYHREGTERFISEALVALSSAE